MRCLIASLLCLLSSTPTFAKEKRLAEPASSGATQLDHQAMVREARVACLNGDYAKGVALLSDLFVDTKDPNHIFNQGRCLEQNQRFEEAIGRFREYLRTETISASDRQAAEKHVAECEALQAKKTAAATAPVAAPAPAPTTILAAPSPSAVTNSASPTEAASVVETASPGPFDGWQPRRHCRWSG